jgi:hypothetical protein
MPAVEGTLIKIYKISLRDSLLKLKVKINTIIYVKRDNKGTIPENVAFLPSNGLLNIDRIWFHSKIR